MMTYSDINFCRLVGSIEKWMESGEPVLTLNFLLDATGGNLGLVQESLDTWQREGRVEWLKPLDPSKPDDQVVRFKMWIRKDVPWRRGF